MKPAEILKTYERETFELDGLLRAAREILDAWDLDVRDRRAADRPDARLVRYYQGLGIMGRPLRYRRRRAIFGVRHLLELLAAKALQARGMTLSRIQDLLAGRPIEALVRVLEEALREDALGPPDEPREASPPVGPPEPGPQAPPPGAWCRVGLPGGAMAFVPARALSSIDPAEMGRRLAAALEALRRGADPGPS